MSTVPLTETRPFTGNDRLLVGIVLSVLTFWLFAQSVINVVPAMKSSLAISLETLTLAVSLSALFSGCFIVASGGLADRFGRVRMTLAGLSLSIIGSALLVFADGPALFLAGRALQGLSAACIMPATLSLIKTWYDGKARQRAVSFWVIGSWGGSGLCSFVGGAIATGLGWRWIFIFSIATALAAMALIRGTPESRSEGAASHRLDLSGLLSLVIGLVLLNLFITKGHVWGWSSATTLLMLAGARLPMMFGPVITVLAILLISCTFLAKETYIITVLIGNVLFGLGLGCYATPSTDTAVLHAPANKVGVASGIYKMGSSLGGAMGIAVTSSLFALFLPLGMASAAQYALLVNCVICLCSTLVTWRLLPASPQS